MKPTVALLSFVVFTILAVVLIPVGHDMTAAGLSVQAAVYSSLFFALGTLAHKVRRPVLYAFFVVLVAQAFSFAVHSGIMESVHTMIPARPLAAAATKRRPPLAPA
ncbi:MAG: hypothetical protein U1F87_03520 [Kiritimatiellia bacterium]